MNIHQVTVVKFLGPEVCHFYFRYTTAGKFSIFGRKNSKGFSLMSIDSPKGPHISNVLFPYD